MIGCIYTTVPCCWRRYISRCEYGDCSQRPSDDRWSHGEHVQSPSREEGARSLRASVAHCVRSFQCLRHLRPPRDCPFESHPVPQPRRTSHLPSLAGTALVSAVPSSSENRRFSGSRATPDDLARRSRRRRCRRLSERPSVSPYSRPIGRSEARATALVSHIHQPRHRQGWKYRISKPQRLIRRRTLPVT